MDVDQAVPDLLPSSSISIWPNGSVLRVMLIDASETTRGKTFNLLSKIVEGEPVELNIEFSHCLDDTFTFLRWQRFDLMIINTNIIDQSHKQIAVFSKIRSLFKKSPIIAVSTDDQFLNSMELITLGVDDCLDLSVINESVLKRVVIYSLQRAKNYRKLEFYNDAQQVTNGLLKELSNRMPVKALMQSCLNLIITDADFIDEEADSAILVSQDGRTKFKIAATGYHVEAGIAEKAEFELNKALEDLDWEISSIYKDSELKVGQSNRRFIPIIHHDRILGVLAFYIRPGYLDVEDEEIFASEVSRCLGGVLNAGKQQQRYQRVFDQNKRLISSISSAIIGVDAKDTVTQWNKAAENIFQFKLREVEKKPILTLPIKWDWANISLKIAISLDNKESSERFEVRFSRANGEAGVLSTAVTPLLNENGEFDGYLLLMDDVTEEIIESQQKQQAERLQSIGQLAAGVAHEINTPIQYVGDNLCFLEESFSEFVKLSNYCSWLVKEGTGQAGTSLAELVAECDLDYLISEVPEAIKETQSGVDHVSNIVRAMKDFSHPGTKEKVATDINKIIDTTLVISRNIWKYVADVDKNMADELPIIPAYPGPINEVILNLIVNASDAISDTQKKGLISISSAVKGEFIEIKIKDTGKGIPEDIQTRIFDPFFTTKEVGKGTGQGLSICHKIIVEQHQGSLSFTTDSTGTCFFILLPIKED